MKKIIILSLSILLLYACSDTKEKNKSTGKSKEQSAGISSEDKAIKEWLLGKEWKAENGGAPFAVLKVLSLDSCAFTNGKPLHWTFRNGRLNMLAEWPLIKVNDTTFTIYVEPTQKTYTYQFVKNL